MPRLEKMMLILQPWQGYEDYIEREVMKKQIGEESVRVVQGIIERRKAAGINTGANEGDGLRVRMYIQFENPDDGKGDEYWRSYSTSPTSPTPPDSA
jgi:hypothetical protein